MVTHRFGFDISSMSAIVGTTQYLDYFDNPAGAYQGAIGSALAAGSIVGCIIAGPLSDRFGRRDACIFCESRSITANISDCVLTTRKHVSSGLLERPCKFLPIPEASSWLDECSTAYASVSPHPKFRSIWRRSQRRTCVGLSWSSSSCPSKSAFCVRMLSSLTHFEFQTDSTRPFKSCSSSATAALSSQDPVPPSAQHGASNSSPASSCWSVYLSSHDLQDG